MRETPSTKEKILEIDMTGESLREETIVVIETEESTKDGTLDLDLYR